ncbi:MAG TPA: MFS transporter [Rhodoglobus sp.]|nr:MFS transporter [Rhodoglobus sp.]
MSFAVTLVAQPLVGALSDRTRARFGGRVPWMLAGAAVGAAAVALMGWAGAVFALCVLWAVGQFALNAVDITLSSSLVDEFPRGRRGGPSGALAASVAIGTGVGAVLAGVLAASPRVAFATVAAVALGGALAFALAGRRVPFRPVVEPAGAAGWMQGLALHRHPDFVWAVAARFAFTLGQQSVSVYLLYVLTDHIGVSGGAAPLLVSGLTATGLVGLLVAALVSGWASDRLGRRRALLVAASFVFGFGMLVPVIAPVLPAMFLFAALQGFGLGMHLSVATALLAEVLPGRDDHAGRDLGLVNVVVNAAQAIAPALAGAIVLASGGYDALFLFALAAAAASALAAWRVRGVQ